MPTAATLVATSPDGHYLLAAGVYKPRIRCFDFSQLSMKFERCLDAEGKAEEEKEGELLV